MVDICVSVYSVFCASEVRGGVSRRCCTLYLLPTLQVLVAIYVCMGVELLNPRQRGVSDILPTWWTFTFDRDARPHPRPRQGAGGDRRFLSCVLRVDGSTIVCSWH